MAKPLRYRAFREVRDRSAKARSGPFAGRGPHGEPVDLAHLTVTSIMSMPTLEQRAAEVVDQPAAARRSARSLDPWAIAVFATVISGAWGCRPSLWFDEGATIFSSASRT